MAIQNIKVSVDAVVFGYSSKTGLSVLLIKRDIEPFKGSWALPGGLVGDEETLEDAVQRELKEETGVSISFLEQLYSFGNCERDPRNRVISVTYYALVRPEAFRLKASTDAAEAEWFRIDKLPHLAFDHDHILNVARERLKSKIQYEPLGFELLEKKFAFSELEKLYSNILNRPIDRRNFKKKILKFGFLDELEEKQIFEGVGRRGSLYSFNEERYSYLKGKGIHFEIT